MRHQRAIALCKTGIAIGTFAIVIGAIPFAIGLNALHFDNMQLTQKTLADLKTKPGGDTLVNCAMASAALANQNNATLNSLVHVSRTQSFMLLIGGVAVIIIFTLLLRFVSQEAKVSA
jgi:hypothetical protein